MIHKRFLYFAPEFLICVGIGLSVYACWFGPKAEREVVRDLENYEPLDASADCGPAALYIIVRLNGKTHSLDELRMLTRASAVGTDMLSLRDAAESLGFAVDASMCNFSTLRFRTSSGEYAIIYSARGHFAAVVPGASRGMVRVVDSVSGVRDMTEVELKEDFQWDGATLLCRAA
jgi:ABC-type bacteriocin/lantibiotic exporter with double-glycine peptidase domain